jgi:hypothetical protein
MKALTDGAERTAEVPLPGDLGTVLLRSITRRELMDIREEVGFSADGIIDMGQAQRMDVLILLAAWVEPAELHDDEDPEALLAAQPAGLINDLVREALKVSGLTNEDRFLG